MNSYAHEMHDYILKTHKQNAERDRHLRREMDEDRRKMEREFHAIKIEHRAYEEFSAARWELSYASIARIEKHPLSARMHVAMARIHNHRGLRERRRARDLRSSLTT